MSLPLSDFVLIYLKKCPGQTFGSLWQLLKQQSFTKHTYVRWIQKTTSVDSCFSKFLFASVVKATRGSKFWIRTSPRKFIKKISWHCLFNFDTICFHHTIPFINFTLCKTYLNAVKKDKKHKRYFKIL